MAKIKKSKNSSVRIKKAEKKSKVPEKELEKELSLLLAF